MAVLSNRTIVFFVTDQTPRQAVKSFWWIWREK
jgi:hypothetical protein